jgi:hypothetical protein
VGRPSIVLVIRERGSVTNTIHGHEPTTPTCLELQSFGKLFLPAFDDRAVGELAAFLGRNFSGQLRQGFVNGLDAIL